VVDGPTRPRIKATGVIRQVDGMSTVQGSGGRFLRVGYDPRGIVWDFQLVRRPLISLEIARMRPQHERGPFLAIEQ
jgi:hypothetical protein